MTLTDKEIRNSFHRKKLRYHHANKNTLVVDELGLNHGKSRADIAVINGHLVGYEIKSDQDSLTRLKQQVQAYNAIFNKSYIIVGDRYQKCVHKHIPNYWGIITSKAGNRSGIKFALIRKAKPNQSIDPIAVAKLLWKNEAVEILKYKKLPSKLLHQSRSTLYKLLGDTYSVSKLQKIVISYLKKRTNWRDQK